MSDKPKSYKVGAFTLGERDLVEMIQRQIIERGVSRKGTCNGADPTAYHNATAYVSFEYDPLFTLAPESEYHDPECDIPGPAIYMVCADDCTWGVSFKVFSVDDVGHAKKMHFEGYYSREPMRHGGEGHWSAYPEDNTEKVCKFLMQAMTDGDWADKPEKLYTPDDVMGDHMGTNV